MMLSGPDSSMFELRRSASALERRKMQGEYDALPAILLRFNTSSQKKGGTDQSAHPTWRSKFDPQSQFRLVSIEVCQIERSRRGDCAAADLKVPCSGDKSFSTEPQVGGWASVDRLPREDVQRGAAVIA